MPRRKRKTPSLPPYGDTGPDTEAQRAGTRIIRRTEANGQVLQRRDRRHIIEIMAQGTRRRPAMISARQSASGMKLVDTYEATELSGSPAWTKVQVDSTPRPDDATISKIHAQWELAQARKAIPRQCLAVVQAVCRDNVSIRPGLTKSPSRAKELLAVLREGLDAAAGYYGV